MTALAADRMTPMRADKSIHEFDAAANAVIYAGALVALSAGYAVPGSTSTGLITVGRAEHAVDNTGGANGAKKVKVRAGVFRFGNSASTDLIARTEIGSDCYVVDDQTVAKTNGSSSRSVAGKIMDVDTQGVWVAVGPGGLI